MNNKRLKMAALKDLMADYYKNNAIDNEILFLWHTAL